MAAVFASTTPSTKALIASKRSHASSWRARIRPAAAIGPSTSPWLMRTAARTRTVRRPSARAFQEGHVGLEVGGTEAGVLDRGDPLRAEQAQRAQQQRVARLARGHPDPRLHERPRPLHDGPPRLAPL